MRSLINLLERQLTESDTQKTQVSEQRKRNHRYYGLQPLGNEQEGRSHYIDPAVFGSVEDKKAIFDETFLSSRQVVRFSGPNAQEAEAKSAYVQRILKMNDYTRLYANGWHDAFVAKRMTVWADWRRDRKEVTLNFLGAPTAQVNAQVKALGEITNVDASELQSRPVPSMTGQPQFVHTGTVRLEVDASFISLDLVPPEYVFRDPSHAYADDAGWNSCKIDISKLELIARGFDPEQVKKLKPETRWGATTEDSARKQHDGSNTTRFSGQNTIDGEQEEVSIFRTRTWLMPEEVEIEGVQPAPGPAIYDIYWSCGEILRWDDGSPAVRICEEMHVYEWGEFKISHAEHALCTADVEAHQQKASSAIKRGIMDNMNIANNPMWEANVSAIRDMRDLYDGVIAGVVETENGQPVGQVKALDMPQLSPLVMGVLQMLERDGEERSGVSTLSRGLNQEVIANQNAESMVDKVMSRGERRVAMAARSFANDFLIPLLQGIVKLGMKYDKSQDVLESGGRKIPIVPAQWQDQDHEMEVEVALTPSEAAEMSMKLLGMDSRLSQDPKMGVLYGLKQKHALYDTVFELMGVKDSTKFMASPDDPAVQQQMMQMQQQMRQQQMKQDQIIMANMEFQADQNAREWAKVNNDIMDDMFDNQLNMKEFRQDTWFKHQELDIERSQQRAATIAG